MIQEIITYIILAGTACVIAFKLFYHSPRKGVHEGCPSGCSGCELKDIKPKNKFII